MEINLDHDPRILTGRAIELAISINGDDHQFITSNPWFQNYSRILQLMYTGALIVMYNPLLTLVQLKFQNEDSSPFETHGSFMIMSIVGLVIATFTSGILFYVTGHSQISRTEHFSLIHYMILKVVFCFSGILAPLSLVLTLFIPHNLKCIGYLIICTLFGVVVGSNFYGYVKLLDKERLMQLKNSSNGPKR